MKKVNHKSVERKGRASTRKAAYGVILAITIVAAGIVIFTNSSETARTVGAQADRAQKKYRGSRAIVKDKATGQVRLPSSDEVDEIVGNLAELTKQPEGLLETPARGGAVSLDLEGGFGGTFLARANSDGSFETRCVFTFEEGVEFLGLVEDPTR